MTKPEGSLEWSHLHNSKFEVNKSTVMHFSRKTSLDLENNGCVPIHKPNIIIEGHQVKKTNTYKYLGILLNNKLNWKGQAQRMTANTTKWILQFRRLTKPSTGIRPKLMHQLYKAVALSKIRYGIDTWYTPPNKHEGHTRNSGSVNALRNLQKIQCMAALAITRTLCSSPNDFIDAHANILPIKLTLQKACHSATIRHLTLPDTNMIHHVIKDFVLHPSTTHLSPHFKLIIFFQVTNHNIETIIPTTPLPPPNTMINTLINNSRESSIQSKASDDADFKLYADGSCYNNGISATAVLYKKNAIQPLKTLQLFSGSPEEHNTFKAEAAGAILTLWIIENHASTTGKKSMSLQSIIQSLKTFNSNSGQHLIQALKLAIINNRSNLTVKWISSHSKVLGNKKADQLAKKAAEGCSSALTSLPHLFRTPLPRSTSRTKQAYNLTLHKIWTNQWNRSPRKNKITQLGEDFPFKKFTKTLSKLTRK